MNLIKETSRRFKSIFTNVENQFVFLCACLVTDPAYANLNSTAKKLGRSAQSLGKEVIFVAVVVTGGYWLIGSADAKEKTRNVAIGVFIVLAAGSIKSWTTGTIR